LPEPSPHQVVTIFFIARKGPFLRFVSTLLVPLCVCAVFGKTKVVYRALTRRHGICRPTSAPLHDPTAVFPPGHADCPVVTAFLPPWHPCHDLRCVQREDGCDASVHLGQLSVHRSRLRPSPWLHPAFLKKKASFKCRRDGDRSRVDAAGTDGWGRSFPFFLLNFPYDVHSCRSSLFSPTTLSFFWIFCAMGMKLQDLCIPAFRVSEWWGLVGVFVGRGGGVVCGGLWGLFGRWGVGLVGGGGGVVSPLLSVV